MNNQKGLTLLESIVAILILLALVLAVGYTFSEGKGNLERLAWRRAALSEAQSRLEILLHSPDAAPLDTTGPIVPPGGFDASHQSLAVATHTKSGLALDGVHPATETWRIWYEDDPADSLYTSPHPDLSPWDNKRVAVTVSWNTGISTNVDSVTVESILPRQ